MPCEIKRRLNATNLTNKSIMMCGVEAARFYIQIRGCFTLVTSHFAKKNWVRPNWIEERVIKNGPNIPSALLYPGLRDVCLTIAGTLNGDSCAFGLLNVLCACEFEKYIYTAM